MAMLDTGSNAGDSRGDTERTTASSTWTSREGKAPRTVKVLLLDDDIIDARTVQHFLGRIEGFVFDMRHVQTVDEAMRAARQEEFDVFLADYWLGAESSVAFIRDVGTRPDAPPIIVFSQLDHSDIQEIGLRAGASAFISKDLLNPELLGSTLRSVLHGSERRHEMQFQLLANGDREAATARGVLDWLTALSGRIDRIHTAAMLSRDMIGKDAAEATLFVDDIIAASAEIRRDLYDRVTRLRRTPVIGAALVTRIDVAELVAETVRLVRPEAERHGIVLDYVHPSIPVLVECDPDGVRTALRLLLVGGIRNGVGGKVLKLRIRIQNGELLVCLTEPESALRPIAGDDAETAPSTAADAGLGGFVLDDHVSALMLVESMLDRQGGRLTITRGETGAADLTVALPMRQAA